MLEIVADGTDGCDKGDSWTLDTALCGLPLVCKLSGKGDFQQILLSLIVDDVLEFGKYSRFILQGGGKGNGVAHSVSRSAPLLNTFAVVRSAAAVRCWTMLVLLSFLSLIQWEVFIKQTNKPCALFDVVYFLGPEAG